MTELLRPALTRNLSLVKINETDFPSQCTSLIYLCWFHNRALDFVLLDVLQYILSHRRMKWGICKSSKAEYWVGKRVDTSGQIMRHSSCHGPMSATLFVVKTIGKKSIHYFPLESDSRNWWWGPFVPGQESYQVVWLSEDRSGQVPTFMLPCLTTAHSIS